LSAQSTLLHALLAFKVSVEKSAIILMVLFLHFVFSLLRPQYSFSVLCACCFNDTMPWGDYIFVKSVWCPGGFLVPEWEKYS
jgi:hypothetical protein